MKFLTAAHTDIGNIKEKNQDAYCLETASACGKNLAFAVLCDGMGGLHSGELASAFVVNAYTYWFETELPALIKSGVSMASVERRWKEIASEQGEKILHYGQSRGIELGTTLTAVLLIESDFIYAQVGDSRMYQLGNCIWQVTKDQSLVAREVELGHLTLEEARQDLRQNILLQCIGASSEVTAVTGFGILEDGDALLLCSDGFRHQISDEEIFGVLAPSLMNEESVIENSLIDLVELNKFRGEQDNITALLIKGVN